jgi:hypothetical protein
MRVSSLLPSNLLVFAVHAQTELIDQILFQGRMIAKLSGFFGVLALVLARIGLYGLPSYEVSRRRDRHSHGARRAAARRVAAGCRARNFAGRGRRGNRHRRGARRNA